MAPVSKTGIRGFESHPPCTMTSSDENKPRTIVVGDVHGCALELYELLEKVKFMPNRDRLISLGDLVDRGPYVHGAVDYFMRRGEAIIGNHEQSQLRYYDRWVEGGRSTKQIDIDTICRFKADYHRDSFMSLEPKHFEWFKSLPLSLRIPEYNVLLVHAGVVPQVPLEDQEHHLTHISDIMAPEAGYDNFGRYRHGYWRGDTKSWWTSKAPPGAKFWATHYDKSHGVVVFGHSGFMEPAWFRRQPDGTVVGGEHAEGELVALGIDTGACFGRTLTCLVLPEWKTYSVHALQAYKVSKKAKLFEVCPGITVYS